MKQRQKITQRALKTYTATVNEVEALQAKLSNLKEGLVYALESGMEVEKGSRVAKLETSTRRSVCWKKVVIRLKSLGYANKVLASTKPITVTKLIVQ